MGGGLLNNFNTSLTVMLMRILIIDVCVKVELVDHYVMRPMICGNEEEQLAYWESKCSSCNVM